LAHFGEHRNTAPGLYALFDIGGGTLDGAAFRLERGKDGPEFHICAAEVDELGTMAIARRLLSCMGEDMEKHFEQPIILGGKSPSLMLPCAEVERSIQVLLHRVMTQTRRKLPSVLFSEDFDRPSPCLRTIAGLKLPIVPIFLAGGGAPSEWYKQVFHRTQADLNQHQYDIGGYEVRLLPPPAGSTNNDYPRFVVASGLTSTRLHFNKYRLPSEACCAPSTSRMARHTRLSDQQRSRLKPQPLIVVAS
jgi:hypothetical protein